MDGTERLNTLTQYQVESNPHTSSEALPSSAPDHGAAEPESREGFFSGCDGTRLYYQVQGQGPLTMVACNGIGVSTFFWKYLQRCFSDRFQVVVWDYRGHGRSAAPYDPHRVSMQDLAEDLHLLLKHLKVDQAITLGHSMGVQVILEHYRTYSQEVRALVPVLGSYGRTLDTFMGYHRSRQIFDRIYDFVFNSPLWARRIFKGGLDPRFALKTAPLFGLVDRFYCPVEDLTQYLEHMSTMDLQLFMRMAMEMGDHSVKDMLYRIDVPTLIIAGERDAFTPLELSEEMHRMIPGSEMQVLREGSHAALIEQPEVMTDRLEQFLRDHRLCERPAT